MYQIEGRDTSGNWTVDVIGNDSSANRFDTIEEAEAAIADLRTCGEDWATGQYRVVAIADVSHA